MISHGVYTGFSCQLLSKNSDENLRMRIFLVGILITHALIIVAIFGQNYVYASLQL